MLIHLWAVSARKWKWPKMRWFLLGAGPVDRVTVSLFSLGCGGTSKAANEKR